MIDIHVSLGNAKNVYWDIAAGIYVCGEQVNVFNLKKNLLSSSPKMQINTKKFLLPVLMETVVSKMLSGHSTQDGVIFSEASKKNLSKKKTFFL